MTTVQPAATLPPTNSNFQNFDPVVQDYEGTVTAAPLIGTGENSPNVKPTGPAVALGDLPIIDCKALNATIASGNTNIEEVTVLDKATYFPFLLPINSKEELNSQHPDDLRGKKAVLLHPQYLPQGRLPSGEEFFFLPKKHFSVLRSVQGEPNGRAFFPLNRGNMVPAFSYFNEKKERQQGQTNTTETEPFTIIYILLLVAISLMTAAAYANTRTRK